MICTPFQYPGSKVHLSAKLPPPLPGMPIIEAFAGAAGYSARYGGHRTVHLIDRDPVVCGAWRFILNATVDDIMKLPDVLELGARPGIDESIEPTMRPFLALWATPAGRPNIKTPVTPRGVAGRRGHGWQPATRQRQADALPARRRWTITEGSYLDAPDAVATWFIDPPYEKAGLDCYGSEIDWGELGGFIESRQGLVIVTTEPDSKRWLPGGWTECWTVERLAWMSQSNRKPLFRELVTIYGGYQAPKPVGLFD